MNIDALPKILFLSQDNEEMQDRRIRVKVNYDTSGPNPIKKTIKKINNTIPLIEQLSKTLQINCLAYSNKFGLLITCLENQILITDSDSLESLIATSDTSPKSLKKLSFSINFSGKIYMVPGESKFLAVNKNQFMLFDLDTQKQITRGTNSSQLRHAVFVTQNSFAAWNFHSEAYLYENISADFDTVKKFQGVKMCTSVNVIQDHIVVFEKINPAQDDEDSLMLVFDQTASNTVNEFSLRKFGNPNIYAFNFTQVISLFEIKRENPEQFSQNDEYGLVLAYYDDFQEEPDRRYVSFMKGNLLKHNAKIQIRSFDLFLSPTEDRSFYYDDDQVKIPFEVQIISTKSIKVIMIEHHEIVFVVDCRLPFDMLNLYTLQPLHEIKLQDKKYFKGICLMKNMLDCERKQPTADSNDACNMICNNFEGQFMSLYFSSKETQMTVPFPESLLILGDNKLFRKYAIQTYEGIEEDNTDLIKEKLTQIFPKQRTFKIQHKKKLGPQNSQGEIKKSSPAPVPVPKEKPAEKVPQKPKEEQKKTGLFGSGSNTSSPFGGSTLFGPKTQTPANSLFGKPSTGAGNSLFDAKPAAETKGSSLFDSSKKPEVGGLFGPKPTESKKEEGKIEPGGLFGNSKPEKASTGLFGQPSETKAPEVKQGGLFSNSQSKSPSSNFLSGKAPESTPFDKSKKEEKPEEKKGALFGGSNLSAITKAFLNNPTTSQPEARPKLPEPVPKVKQPKQEEDKKPKVEEPKKQQKPAKKDEKPSKKKEEAPKNEVKKQSEEEKNPVNLEKLKELATFFGHDSPDFIPAPLKNLTEEQIDALISQMSLVIPKKPLINKSEEYIARESLLKDEHFTKIVTYIDNTTNYVKKLREINEAITSPQIFTLSNARELAKSRVEFDKKPQVELKSKNPFSNVVKNYAQRMQFLQKQYISMDEEENINPNNPREVERRKKTKEQRVVKDMEKIEEKIQCFIVYQRKIGTEEPKKGRMISFFQKNLESDQNFDDKLTNLIKEKAEKCTKLCKTVNVLLKKVDDQLKESSWEKPINVRSSAVFTTTSKQNKKKGKFAFNLESSGSSEDEISNAFGKKSAMYQSCIVDEPQKVSNILIKFKPKTINLTGHEAANYIPLVNLKESSRCSVEINDKANATALFAAPANQLLQNSMKKSVNFKDKIPFKKNDDEKIKKTFKYADESQDLDSEDSEEEVKEMTMSRGISKIKPQEMFTKKIEQKPSFAQPKATDLLIKKTAQVNVPAKKAAQDSTAGLSAFGITDKKVEQKQTKTVADGTLPVGSLFGSKEPQTKKGLLEQPKVNQQKQAKKGAITSFEGKLFGSNKEETKKDEPKVEKKEEKKVQKPTLFGNLGTVEKKEQQKGQKPSLFGNLGTLPTASTGGLFGASTAKTQTKPEEKEKEKKPETKLTEPKKQQPKIDKKQATGLFGSSVTNQSSGSLFGSGSTGTLFSNASKSAEEKKPAEGGLFSNVPKVQKKPAQSSSKPVEAPPVKTDEVKAKQENVGEKKPVTSLFGNAGQNKTNLFGNNTSTLFTKKDEPKVETSTAAASKPVTEEPKKASVFGSGGLFSGNAAGSGGLFGQSNAQKQPELKPTTEVQKNPKPTEAPKPQNSLFGASNSTDQTSKTESKGLLLSNQQKAQISQNSNQSAENSPVQAQNQTGTLFGNTSTTAQSNLFGQQNSTSSSLGTGLFNQSKPPAQTFGAANRFMAQESAPSTQPQQNAGFNPNALTFAAESGFSQSGGSGFKSFSSFGGNQSGGGLFGQSNNNQSQSNPPFGGSSLLGNSLQNSMGNNQQQANNQTQPLFGGFQQPGQGMFGNTQQSNQPLFGGMNQQQQSQGSSNFMQGFNPTAPGFNVQPNAGGNAPNASMFKARK